MPCSWQKEDYFSILMSSDKRAHTALEMLVDDLHAEKEKTVNAFLCHSGSEDFLWGLVRLLGNDTPRVAGNAAYILGTLAESEIGCMRVISLVQHGSSESKKILPDLTRMLTFDDSESVMNAAGTMGTLAESHEGREWILSEKCLPQTLEHITSLLHSENLWTASNAALVLARLSISECGCSKVLEHEHSQHILSKLILSLGIDEAGRGMNAAFAIGRLCDMDQGRKRLLQLTDSERMISSLAKMLSCNDTGASKNACFALSCLATNSEGHSRLLGNVNSEEILKTLSVLLNAEDSETGWFAAMTLRTLASQPKGCLRLRDHIQVISSLKSVEGKADINADLKEEAIITLEILKRLPKPSPPTINVVSANTLKATWDPIVTKSGFQVRYQLFDGTKCVYTGKQCECEVIGLQPNTPYIYKLRAYTEGDESPFSDIVSIITEEAVPGPPQSVRVLGATITQLKIGWDPPAESNGVLKGYYVFIDDKEVMHTIENSVILTGLTANTTYDVEVCAATAKGRGERNGTTGTTSEIGAHAPSKPHINVIGRNELYISWAAPEVPLGRLNRYDVIMNDKVIYSGSDLNLPVRRLVPDTEYSFVVVALTSEGKFESKMAKKRTAKDEYDQARPPLYQAPKKEPTEEGSKTPVGQPTVKRRKSSARVSSAKAVPKRVGTGKERTKSSGSINKDERPVSGTSSTSHHDVVEDKIEKIDKIEKQPDPLTAVSLSSSSNNSPAPSSTPSPLVGKPVAEVKFEAPAPRIPSSKTRMPRTLNKIERNTVTSRPQPVAISTVSMQNSSKTEHYGKNSEINETDKKVIENGKKKPEKDLPVLSNSLKVERSRTTFSGRENRRGKFTSSPSNSYVSNTSQNVKPDNDLEKGETLNKISPEKIRPITNDRESGSVNVSRRSRVSEENILMSSREKDKGITKEPRERSSRGQSSRTKAVKDANLPKPAPPSQKYLEGTAQVDVPWGHRTIPSPRSSKDAAFMDSDWLTQVKSVSENYTRPFANSNVLSNSADSTYFIDPSQFLQRTNTYISSHRRRYLDPLPELEYPTHSEIYEEPVPVPLQELEPWSERKSHGGSLKRCNSSKERVSSSKITLQHFKFTSQIKLISRDHDTESGDVERPIGRKSLERLQKSNQGMKAPMPAKLGQSVNNFDFDIPENTSSKLANKFIPMQLRTQPSNLGMGQLQRVNTTLMGELTGDNSVSFRRVEAMTRSHTQMDMKQQNQFDLKQPTTFDLKQHAQQQIPMENRRDLGFLTNKDKDRAMKKASSTGKVHKLGGSALTSHQRNKEPDSMYLQQSWGLNSTTDLGALQNVR